MAEKKNYYPLDELKKMILCEYMMDKINASKKPLPYEDTVTGLLHGEIFKKWKNKSNFNIEVSNLGRIKIDNVLQEQVDEPGKKGYLVLKPSGQTKGKSISGKHVWNFVAETWLSKNSKPETGSDGKTKHVHHITNNGYDNSVENLIYLTKDEHKKMNEYIILKRTSCDGCKQTCQNRDKERT